MARAPSGGALKEDKVLSGLARSPLEPFYLLSGKERFFVERCLSTIKKRVVTSPDKADLLYHAVHASEAGAESLVNLAQTPPFFDERQLVVVREAQKLADSCRQALKKYAEDPAPFTSMVLVVGDKAPAGEPFKTLQKQNPGGCFNFPALRRPQLRKWAERIAGEKGLEGKVPKGYIATLAEGEAVSLQALEHQLEMVSLFLGSTEESVSAEEFPGLFADLPEEQGWLLTDPLMAGNEQKTMAVLHRFLEQGTSPLSLFGRIVWMMRRVRRVQEAFASRDPLEDVYGKMGVRFDFQRKAYTAAARRIPENDLHTLYASLLDYDRTLKRSRLSPQWHLEKLCRDLVAIVRRTAR